jgi:hypothetical protein
MSNDKHLDTVRELVLSEDSLKKQVKELTTENRELKKTIATLQSSIADKDVKLAASDQLISQIRQLLPSDKLVKTAQPFRGVAGCSVNGCDKCNPNGIEIPTNYGICLMCGHIYYSEDMEVIKAICGCKGVGSACCHDYSCDRTEAYSRCGTNPKTNKCWECR